MPLAVSVVIPTWQRPRELERCLPALIAQRCRPAEVIVVVRREDGPSRKVVDDLAHLGPLSATEVTTPGLVAALEAGRRAATGDVLAFTDDDAVPESDWLDRIVAHFAENARLGAVGGRDRIIGNDDPQVPSSSVGRVFWYGRRIGAHHRGVGPALQVDVVKGVNIAFRASALAPIGFDERLRGAAAQAHSELAACLALKRAGWQVIYDPAVAVDHFEGPRFDDTERGFGNLSELTAATHNEMYAMVRWLPPWRKPFVVVYGLFVGYRQAPGVITVLGEALRTRNWRLSAARLTASTRGRLAALGTYGGVVYEGRKRKRR